VSALDYTWGFYGDQDSSQLIRIIASNGAYERFSIRQQLFALGQLSRFVPPGAVRIGATSNDPAMLPLAFVDGAKLIIVVVFTGEVFERPVNIELGTATPCVKRATSVRTGDVEQWLEQKQYFTDIPRISVTMPAHSMITFVAQE
jgi:glucuronoarabinoxylan endo-1,4-beta-xylanase